MAKALVVSEALSVAQLRDLVHRESDGRVIARLLAVAHLLSGHSPAQSEDLFGLKATQLRFRIRRYNAEGVAGLADRPRCGARPRLSPTQCDAFLVRCTKDLWLRLDWPHGAAKTCAGCCSAERD